MEKDKGSTLKSIMRSSKKDRNPDPYEDYKKSPVTKIYHRITSTSFLPYRWKQALIIGGIIILVVGIITTIAVVISKQDSKSHNGKYYHSEVISFHKTIQGRRKV